LAREFLKLALNELAPAAVSPLETVSQVTAGEAILALRSDPLQKVEKPAFEQLMAEHRQRVVRTAYRLLGRMEDAQDAAQEVFLRLLRNLDRIEGDPQAWLYRVTVNICNDHYRRRTIMADPEIEQADPAPDPERVLALDERRRLLMEGLETLGERERTAVVLRDIEGLSTREVAAIMGVEEVTVRTRISVARVKLAKYVRKRK
jgi:RNA polymerase sigma-70 factor, ECF subfamily